MQALDTPAYRARVEDFQRRHETKIVTMLFSDIVGSTQIKSTLGDREGVQVILRHHEVFRQTLAEFPDAEEIGTAGDSFFMIFAKPSDGVRFALLVQRNLRKLAADTGRELLDRIGIHVGEVWIDHNETATRSKDLYGTQVDLCARVSSLANADQILLTRFPFDSARQVLSRDEVKDFAVLSWLNHGLYLLKGIDEPIEICEVGEAGNAYLKSPADSEKATRYLSADAEPVLGWRPAIGQTVPETSWILDEKLGEGGFGEVWSGHDKILKTQHVFKFCFRAERARSLKREVTIFRLLKERIGSHPNIVAIENVYFEHPPFYIVMEQIDGCDLSSWFNRKTPSAIPLDSRLRLIAQVADAVQAAHDTGIVHRDIKPSNILVKGTVANAHAYLTDFGIGNITSDSLPAGITAFGFSQTVTRVVGLGGTQLYMAPELLIGQAPSVRSDIYSLGVVLYQTLVADFTSPVTSDWPSEIADPLLREDLQLCFAKDPLKRFASAGELARRLRTLPQRHSEREAALASRHAEEERKKNELVAKENRRYSIRTLWTAAFEAPLMGAIVGWALYFTDDESGVYDFASAFHIPTYIFLLCLLAVYFGFDAGMRAYFRDSATAFVAVGSSLKRYVLKLCASSTAVVALQVCLMVLVGNNILQIREMFPIYVWFTFLVGFCSVSLGCLVASLVKTREAGVRVLLVLIIFQFLFGGALVKYDEMNHNVDLIYGFKRWLTRHPEENSATRNDAALRVPYVARLTPAHYGYEALIVAQAKLNPLTVRQDQVQRLIDKLISMPERTPQEATRLEDLKDTLAYLSGLEAVNVHEIDRRLKRVDEIIAGKVLDPATLRSRPGVTAERLYCNQKVMDLVAKAETEQNDYRRSRPINVFFSPEKHYDISLMGKNRILRMSTLTDASFILLLGTIMTTFLFYLNLRFRNPHFRRQRLMQITKSVEVN